MTTAKHHHTQDELTRRVPGAGEAVRVPGHARADADGAVRGDHLEDDVEGREDDRVAGELALFDRLDHEDRDADEPEVVAELAAQLLSDEVLTCPGRSGSDFGLGAAGEGHGTSDAREDAIVVGGVGFCALFFFVDRGVIVLRVRILGQILRVETEGPFFVDVGVPDCHGYGECAQVHHEYVEHEETLSETGN